MQNMIVKKGLVCGILILFVGAGLARPGYNLTVSTDKPQYYNGEIVRISGRLTDNGNGISAEVCINVTDPNGVQIDGICIVTNSAGYYWRNITLDSDAIPGVYHVTVDDEVHGIQASTSFTVFRLGYYLTVVTDKSQYNPAETVHISGQFTNNGIGISGSVCVEVTDPNENLIDGICVVTNSAGYYWRNTTLDSDAIPGQYNVTADNETHGIHALTSFNVVPGILCGDANNDGKIDVGDIIYLINFLFKGPSYPAPVPEYCCGDANGDGLCTVGDVVYLINYLFKGGLPPGGCCQ
jgi:uncharacterized protein YfaS (alpha-2-macroglobulin family)